MGSLDVGSVAAAASPRTDGRRFVAGTPLSGLFRRRRGFPLEMTTQKRLFET
eukprot:m.115175 g.115175  ORF g.115175 m.115175 type:complete len:52 (-) comp16045_c0_seq1:1262-1417(-)